VPHSIEYAPVALRQLKRISKQHIESILERIEQLPHNPRPPGVEKLTGTNNEYRIRVGDFRVIYLIEKKRLLILKVAHRRDAYRKR